MCDVAWLDGIRNEYIRRYLRITNITRLMGVNTLRWFELAENRNN